MNPEQSNSSEAALHAIDYWQVIKNRYGIILLTFLLVFMTALVITYVMPKRYESSATIQVRPAVHSVQVLPGYVSQDPSAMSQTFFPTEFEVIRAQKTLDIVVDELDLVNRWGEDRNTCRKRLGSIIDAQNIRGTDLIEIRVRASSASDAKEIADAVSNAYRIRRNNIEQKRTDKALGELEEAVQSQIDLVEDKRQALTRLIRKEGVIYTPDRLSGESGFTAREQAESTGLRYAEAEASRIELESQIETLLEYDGDQLITYAASLNLPENTIRTLYPEWQEAKRNLAAAELSGLGAQHPTVGSQRKIIEGLEGDLKKGVDALRSTLNAQLAMARDRAEKLKEKLGEEEEAAVTHGIARHSFDEARADFETAVGLLEQLKIKLISEQMQRRIQEDPVVVHADPVETQTPVSPNVKLNLALGAVVGLIFGIGIAFFLEYLDTSVKTLEDVERYLQVPVLAVIPKDVGVLYKQSGMSPDAEAYRILRTNIEFNRKNPEDNSITVVSGGAGEGKSTTLVNLAYICAQGGYTTLMIDADLRRPRLHTFFDINNAVGLTNYLTTDLMLEDVILQTPVDNLYFMPSGILPADAAGILNSRRMSELIQDVKQRFDLVLVDSPPILGVSDAAVLASEVDLTMVVIQHRKLPRNMLLRVKSAVENVGGHVIGVVLNNVDVRSDSQYQYYTSYYTYYAPTDASVSSGAPSAPRGKTSGNEPVGSKDDLY